MSATTSPAPAADSRSGGTLRGLITAHKLIALAVAAVLALVVGMFVLAAVGTTDGAITDTTSCTQWGSSSQSLQTAYAQGYIRRHVPQAQAGISPASVISAINNGCGQAFGDDVADTTSVAQAISGNF